MKYSIVVILIFACAGCRQALVPNQPDMTESRRKNFTDELVWSLPQSESIRSPVILIHGLNNKPALMDHIGKELNQRGYPTLRVSLSGHRPGETLADSGFAEFWREDMRLAVAESRARFPHAAPGVVGFSLGGILPVEHLIEHPNSFSSMVLLAPGIRFTARAGVLRLISHLRYFGGALPSRSYPEYRMETSTPFNTYHELFELADSIYYLKRPAELKATPCTMILSERDELISATKLRIWLSDNGISNWQVRTFVGKPVKPSFDHFILDQDSVGIEQWKWLIEAIDETLKQ